MRTKVVAAGTANARHFTSQVAAQKLPQEASITYQGMLSEHSYTLDKQEEEEAINAEVDIAMEETSDSFNAWLSVLLKSKNDGAPRGLRPVDIVIALDNSGSMRLDGGGSSKMDIAKEGIKKMFTILRPDDRIGLCRFNDRGEKILDLEFKRNMTERSLNQGLKAVQIGGGTDLQDGYSCALSVFQTATNDEKTDPSIAASSNRQTRSSSSTLERQKWILFMTDMEGKGPNLANLLLEAKRQQIFTIILGLGLDFNITFTKSVIKVAGANYFATKDGNDVEKIMVKDFHFNFFPSCHDTRLTCSSDQFNLLQIYGAPIESDKQAIDYAWLPATHQHFPKEMKDRTFTLLLVCHQLGVKLPMIAFSMIMDMIAPKEFEVLKLGTMFPSNLKSQKVEGGMMLMKLVPKTKTVTNGTLGVGLNWVNLDGKEEKSECTLQFNIKSTPKVGERGVNLDKGYALSEYVRWSHHIIKKQKLTQKEVQEVGKFQNWFAAQTETFRHDDKFLTRKKDFQRLLDIAGPSDKGKKSTNEENSKLKTKTARKRTSKR
mmetsp:Transcript_10581/g.11520  ORF Transcript_10581/g.11520 Transcript_10581/m.11520 type:complete len:545 (+) Transcript_10581:194-1828(+)|eukprot:CAMPEP_0115006332 /NCGR_PEP_ID=MMETSP0216-20121206/20434_1 /TAXON_ID=223996 /ORGANISM="Protocruzia adherens, Strain Boccale" /LENGTH=544 /DNA_ID=CAMNT_0002372889 /DNA_START=857 /DNA_END=2494 /DNA_ORIENTATION=-